MLYTRENYVLQMFETLNKRSATVLKLLEPAVILINNAMQTEMHNGSQELEAFKQLEKDMKQHMNALETLGLGKTATNALIDENTVDDYDNQVQVKLAISRIIFDRILSHKKVRKYQAEFYQECRKPKTSPLKVLHWIHMNVAENCIMPTKVHARIYSSAISAFHAMEQKLTTKNEYSLHGHNGEKYRDLKRKIIDSLTAMEYTGAELHIRRLEAISDPTESVYNTTLTVPDAVKALGRIYSDVAEDIPFKCLLKSIMEGNGYRRNAVLKFSKILYADVLRLEIMSGLCANSSYTDGRTVNEAHEEVNGLVEAISRKVISWILAKLMTAWPSVVKTEIRRALNGKLDPEQYGEVAYKIQYIADSIDPEKFVHQVIVFPNYNSNYYWTTCLEDESCIFMQDMFGVNIIVTRYETPTYQRAVNAVLWLDSTRDQIKSTLSESLSKITLSSVAESIRQNIGRVEDPSLFRHAILIRHTAFWCSNVLKPLTGLATTKVDGILAHAVFEDYTCGRIWNLAVKLELYLFI
ncbi:hypothetical protein Ddc_20081 [Ditylenchus destructor]|nr:hypothetical protein Ddc_20081 [Ditylenchus destructor]